MKNYICYVFVMIWITLPLTNVYSSEFSRIEEEMLLNPPGAGIPSEEVMIYSRVRNKTIHKAMDTQFHRIGNMMFVNSVIESETDDSFSTEDDDCD